ncbi:MAG: hypothetical protein KGL39_41855 [Patescibacteria group bacterium]|nr:hypothetical protein [Patescibacteria group bacterium]
MPVPTLKALPGYPLTDSYYRAVAHIVGSCPRLRDVIRPTEDGLDFDREAAGVLSSGEWLLFTLAAHLFHASALQPEWDVSRAISTMGDPFWRIAMEAIEIRRHG